MISSFELSIVYLKGQRSIHSIVLPDIFIFIEFLSRQGQIVLLDRLGISLPCLHRLDPSLTVTRHSFFPFFINFFLYFYIFFNLFQIMSRSPSYHNYYEISDNSKKKPEGASAPSGMVNTASATTATVCKIIFNRILFLSCDEILYQMISRLLSID